MNTFIIQTLGALWVVTILVVLAVTKAHHAQFKINSNYILVSAVMIWALSLYSGYVEERIAIRNWLRYIGQNQQEIYTSVGGANKNIYDATTLYLESLQK